MQGSSGDADIENRFVNTAWEGEGGMNKEGSIETYTSPCVKKTASGNLLYDAGSSNLVLCDNLEGWDGVGGGRQGTRGADSC